MIDAANFYPSLDGYQADDSVDKRLYTLNNLELDKDFKSEPIYIGNMQGFSIVISCPANGAPGFTLKLQGCNDPELRPMEGDSVRLVNWFDVASGGDRTVSGTISSATLVHLTDPFACYRFVRLSATHTAGFGWITVRFQGKS